MPASRTVTFKGSPLFLEGTEAAVGSPAPPFSVLGSGLARVTQAVLAGKTSIIITVPSLDTPVCDTEARRFNKEAASLGSAIQILCISMDLPFAQERWCGAAGISAVRTLSDHRTASFGEAYGVLLKELRLLTRAVFIVDAAGILRYKEIVPEMGNEPDYAAALATAKRLA